MLLPVVLAQGPIVLEALPDRQVAWAISPDRRTAATLGGDGEVALWSVAPDARAHLVRRFEAPPWPEGGTLPAPMAVSNGGAFVALRRPQGGFDFWDAAKGKVVRRVEVPNPDDQWRVVWLPKDDGALFEAGRSPRGGTGLTRLVRLDGRTLDLPVGAPWGFTPDGKAVLGTSGNGLALVDLATGRVRRRFEDASESFAPYAFSPDGALLATGGEDPAWRGPEIGPDDPAPTEAAYAHTLKIKVWNVASGRRVRMRDGYFSPNDEGRLVFLDRRRLAAPGLGWTLDVPTGRIVGKYEPIESGFGLTLSTLSAASLRERTVVFPERPAFGRHLAISPNGPFLVASEGRRRIGDRPRLLLWDPSRNRLLRRIELPEILNLNAVGFAPDGRLLVDGNRPPKDRSGTTELWPQSVTLRIEIVLDPKGKPLSRKTAPLADARRGLPFEAPPIRSHDGEFAIQARPGWGAIPVDLVRTDAKTGKEAWTNAEIDFLHSRLVFSPDDRRFAVAWSKGPLTTDTKPILSVFDASSGKPLRSVPLGPTLWSLAYSPDGSRLLLATPQGLEMRDATTLGTLARVDESQESGDASTAWLPDGGFAVVRQGRDLRLYDAGMRLRSTLVAFPGSGWVAWTPAGRAEGSPDGLSRLRRAEGARLLPLGRGGG